LGYGHKSLLQSRPICINPECPLLQAVEKVSRDKTHPIIPLLTRMGKPYGNHSMQLSARTSTEVVTKVPLKLYGAGMKRRLCHSGYHQLIIIPSQTRVWKGQIAKIP